MIASLGNQIAASRPPMGTASPRLTLTERRVHWWAIAVFIAILGDGAVRKWVLPGQYQAIPYLAKDVLVILFLTLLPWRSSAKWPKRFYPYLAGVFVFLLPGLAIGAGAIPVGAILVVKNAVLWPLFAVRLATLLTDPVIKKVANTALVATVGMAALAVAQYLSPQDSLLNRYAWDNFSTMGNVAVAGEYVRATGTFSYLTGLSGFGMAMFCLFLGHGFATRRQNDLIAVGIGLVGSLVCGLVTGSRSVQVFMLVVIAVAMISMPRQKSGRVFLGLMALAVMSIVLFRSTLGQGVLGRWSDTNRQETSGRITGSTTGQPVLETMFSNPLGIGLGSYSGVSAYQGTQESLAYNESFLNKLAAEAGVFGMIAFLLQMAAFVYPFRKTLLASVDRRARVLPIAFGGILQVGLGVWYDHVGTALWWWLMAFWLAEAFAVQPSRMMYVWQPAPRGTVARS